MVEERQDVVQLFDEVRHVADVSPVNIGCRLRRRELGSDLPGFLLSVVEERFVSSVCETTVARVSHRSVPFRETVRVRSFVLDLCRIYVD